MHPKLEETLYWMTIKELLLFQGDLKLSLCRKSFEMNCLLFNFFVMYMKFSLSFIYTTRGVVLLLSDIVVSV